ncbi:rCG63077, partial [Rattus norvegicus]
MSRQMRKTAAFCLLALVLHSLPQHIAAAGATRSESVWDGGGCLSQDGSQETRCWKAWKAVHT